MNAVVQPASRASFSPGNEAVARAAWGRGVEIGRRLSRTRPRRSSRRLPAFPASMLQVCHGRVGMRSVTRVPWPSGCAGWRSRRAVRR